MSNVSQERRSEADELMEKCLEILVGSRRVYEQLQLLVAERDKYKAALEWYADVRNWEFDWTDANIAAADDDGKRAREALEGGSSND